MRQYLVIYEKADSNWAAYSPDVPGCMATAKTRKGVERRFREALQFHLEGLREAGLPIPKPTATYGFSEVPALR
ncbi:MAG: type II toxin-antitoxin system HicB family antitoxin [Candidatus Sumerlaeaceae bacterium]